MRPSAVVITAVLLVGILGWRLHPASAQAPRPLPLPVADEARGSEVRGRFLGGGAVRIGGLVSRNS